MVVLRHPLLMDPDARPAQVKNSTDLFASHAVVALPMNVMTFICSPRGACMTRWWKINTLLPESRLGNRSQPSSLNRMHVIWLKWWWVVGGPGLLLLQGWLWLGRKSESVRDLCLFPPIRVDGTPNPNWTDALWGQDSAPRRELFCFHYVSPLKWQ